MQNMGHQDIPALAIDNVSKIYVQWQRSGKMKDIVKNLFSPEKREIKALDGLSFKVSKGEFLAYAGANGAGKSTTIKILSGILQPSSGNISVLGMAPGKERIKLMENIGVLFGQRTELWWDHPVITSYEWKKSVWNIPQDIFDENLAMVTELLDLSDILKTFARELSLGQRMRADLGMLLLHNPQIIFLDEPTLGLDVLAKKKMINFLKKLNREKGTTIVVTSHDMDDLEEMVERIILLSKGQIAFDGNFEELRKVQNNSSRLIITSTGEAPVLDEMEFIGSEDGKHSYKFDKEKIKINDIFKKLSQYTEIVDIEIIKAPIEDIIADLYNSWKK
ncbi:MAG TPA: ATP-binding cassette domain-containing protein [Fusobacterium ulcerans]|nr:ATP-binding cassette domain-containing protein [Fusobacterium ulcerans]